MSILRKSVKKVLASLQTRAALRSARRQLLLDDAVSGKEKALLHKVSLQIHRSDGMYDPYDPTDARHYLSVGLSAIRCIDHALDRANRNSAIRSVLDFPCGHGRVLRFLRARFPDAEITAAEIDAGALEFCRREFSVKAVVSDVDFTKVTLPGKFDLIWCGSLATHTDEKVTGDLLRFFHDHLSPGGVCVFSTHGKFVVASVQDGKETYGLTPEGRQSLLSQFHDKGYGYADYADNRGYGISVVTHQRMVAIAHGAGRWKETSFLERGWDDHHDVHGYTVPS